MDKKLFHVRINCDLFVTADDAFEAFRMAEGADLQKIPYEAKTIASLVPVTLEAVPSSYRAWFHREPIGTYNGPKVGEFIYRMREGK